MAANIVGVEPDPENLEIGMALKGFTKISDELYLAELYAGVIAP